MSKRIPFELKTYTLPNESSESLQKVYAQMRNDGVQGVLAPLTLLGAKNLTDPSITTFIPTVHKRDAGGASANVTFGAIDYSAQLEALLPYMANGLSVFYDQSSVGNSLAKMTQDVAQNGTKKSKSVALYPVDTAGSSIAKYCGRPAAFSKKSVISHLPIVKTSMLAAHLTFVGAHEHNILSTQINYDPTLITLTQYKDRRNMIIANSIIEQVPSIYEINALMNNDLTFDWILYTSSVGVDYLVSTLTGAQREYSMRLIDAQVVYSTELLQVKEFGFEPLETTK
jgi:hypothetical protein